MPVWITVLVLCCAAAAGVAFFLAHRRADTAERTVRSIARTIGSDNTGAALIDDVRSIVREVQKSDVQVRTNRELIEGASIGIGLISASGTVEYANPAAVALMDQQAVPAVLRTRMSVLAQRVIASGDVETIEIDMHDPDRRVLALTAIPLDPDAAGVSVAGLYIEDMSDQRRVDAMRSDFVANAGHELKTPLGALTLLAETLADAQDEAMRARLASRLRSEASRMANVVDDVLQLAETEALGAEYVPVALAAVVVDAAASVESLSEETNVAIVEGDIADATVSGVSEQLTSAVRNLLVNAISYTAITDDPRSVSYRCYLDGSTACIEIEDTGIGIPSRYLDRVFERFFRVDRARSRDSGGTGLGLSIVRNVALAHGGSVDVRSEVGVGSAFTIRLPMIPKDAQ